MLPEVALHFGLFLLLCINIYCRVKGVDVVLSFVA
jgi:hypothetical protein